MGNYGSSFGTAVAEQLRAERSAKKMSQRRLAELADMSEQSVMRYLVGIRDIPITALADIAEALDLTVQTVIERAAQRMVVHPKQDSTEEVAPSAPLSLEERRRIAAERAAAATDTDLRLVAQQDDGQPKVYEEGAPPTHDEGADPIPDDDHIA